jgi:chromate transporter
MGMMAKTFVDRRRDLTKEELMDFISFCQMLPGASSTQTLTLIGYKRGGIPLALLTLVIWMLPACIIMGAFSFLINSEYILSQQQHLFKFVPELAIGFLAFAAFRSFQFCINNHITQVVMLVAMVATFLFFKVPWIFPILIVCGGIVTNFSSKRIPEKEKVRPKQIRWSNLWLFALLFVLAGFLSERARKQEWEHRKAFNLFENFYRFGSIVFGGGDVLIPMMIDQYVARPTADKFVSNKSNIIKIERDELLTGAGLVRAIPGPVFSIASYTGGVALKEKGTGWQIAGCIIGAVAIFLPSVLLVLFFFPVWQYLKKYVIVFRALEGINAVVVGFMWAATLYLLKDVSILSFSTESVWNIAIIAGTFCTLQFSKLPTPFIVLLVLAVGLLF